MLVALSILLSFCVILSINKFTNGNYLFDEFGFVSVFQTILFSRFFGCKIGFPQPFQAFVWAGLFSPLIKHTLTLRICQLLSSFFFLCIPFPMEYSFWGLH
jgi:predicted membrane protein